MARVCAAAPPRLMDSSDTVLEFSLPLTQRPDGAVGHCAVLLKPKLWSAEAAAVCRYSTLKVWCQKELNEVKGENGCTLYEWSPVLFVPPQRECFTMFYMFLSLSLSLQICRLFLFSAARPCWRVLCVVACCGFKIVLQNAGSFLETKHDRAMKVWSWFWGKVGQTMRNYCIYRRLPSYLLRPFVAGSISVQAKCCLAELEFSDAGTQHTWMMPQADQHREADVSRNDMISNAPKWLEWFAGVPTCSGYKIL